VVDRARAAGAGNVGILFDIYHLASNGDDIDRAIASYADQVAHVQIADAPGRGEPGTGRLDLDGYLTRLGQAGYAGWVGLEYKPTVPTVDSLAWLPRERRAGPGPGAAGPRSSAAGRGVSEAGPGASTAGPGGSEAGPGASAAGPGGSGAGPGGSRAGRSREGSA